jgi:hypothetical protein
MVRRRTLEVVGCGTRRHLMKLLALRIDLGKTVFHLVGLNQSGQVVVGVDSKKTLACLGSIEYSSKNQVSLKNTIGSTD